MVINKIILTGQTTVHILIMELIIRLFNNLCVQMIDPDILHLATNLIIFGKLY